MSRWAPGEVVRDDYLVGVPGEVEYDGASVVVYQVVDDGFEDLGAVPLDFEAGASAWSRAVGSSLLDKSSGRCFSRART
jgi:hypothetical protein